MAKAKETKPTKNVAKPMKKEVEVIKEEIVVPIVKKSKKELKAEFKKLRNEIEVEIQNLSSGRVCHIGKDGDIVFDLSKPGDRESIDLEDAYRIANKHKGYFERHYINIIDVDGDYEISDVLNYLNIKSIYDGIDNYDSDYIEEILLENDAYDFEKAVDLADRFLLERIADRARYLYKNGKFDSTSRARKISEKLNIDDLFELM